MSVYTKKENVGRFQSTLPVWGATEETENPVSNLIFQSTLPVWGAT